MVETIRELIENGYMITKFDANIHSRQNYAYISARKARTNKQNDENPWYFISVELEKYNENVRFNKRYDTQGMYGVDLKALGEIFYGDRIVVEGGV